MQKVEKKDVRKARGWLAARQRAGQMGNGQEFVKDEMPLEKVALDSGLLLPDLRSHFKLN